MSNPAAERRLLRNSVMAIILGTALVWLPVVNMLANQDAAAQAQTAGSSGTTAPGDPAPADAREGIPVQLLLTCILANVGIVLLILINVRVNLRRLRQPGGSGTP
jgi:hypothetical protein